MANLILIGVGRTVSAVRAALAATPGGPEPAGALLLRREAVEAPSEFVLGLIDDLPIVAAEHDVEVALVCLPAAMTGAMERVRNMLAMLGISMRVAPDLEDVLGAPAAETAAEFDLVGLAGRSAREADPARLDAVLAGKRVLITGAGGSIGSELARQAASRRPEELILMDRSENALFEIDQEISRLAPGVRRRAVLHDVVDAEGTLRLFGETRPHTVYHAAAHKHVPMMEDHPAHAVNNNLFGAKAAADAAMQTGVERFVFVSTDKAVNPSSVMGATKRLAEQYVRGMGSLGGPRFCMVRFGNVLGSSGSVLTIWKNQIEAGGPVSVTDPEMTRFFMTIPEAASLVVQASALDPAEVGGADVFVLDMGDPVRVLDLACRAIHAAGFQPLLPPGYRDPERLATNPSGRGSIRVEFTGARPGEKIHEQLAHAGESLQNTPISGIMAWAAPGPSAAELHAMTLDMARVRHEPRRDVVLDALRRWTPSLASSEQEPKIVVRDLGVPVG